MVLRNNIRGGACGQSCDVNTTCGGGKKSRRTKSRRTKSRRTKSRRTKSRRTKSRRTKSCRKRHCHNGGGILENLGKVVIPTALSYALFKVGRKTRKRRKSKKSK